MAQMQTPGGAAAAFSGWTIVVLIVIALGAAAIIAGMIYGNRLARQRHRATEAAGERAEEAGLDPVPAPSSAVEDPSQAIVKEKDPADRAAEQRAPPSAPPKPAAAAAPPPDGAEAANPAPTPAPAATPAPAPARAETKQRAAAPDTDAPAIEPAIAGALALTTIKGLGPKVAALLADRGITRVDQIAALSDADARALDARLGAFTGRMTRDRWLDQARLLASGDTAAYEAEFGKLG